MNLLQFYKIIWCRKLIVLSVLLVIISGALVVNSLLPKQYVAMTTLVIDQRTVDPFTGLVVPSSQLLPSYMATQAEIIASHNVAYKVVQKLKIAENSKMQADFAKTQSSQDIADWLADMFLTKLDVKPSRESSMISISYTAVDPKFAAMVANAFAESYINASVELRSQPAKLNADWFDMQMLSMRERLELAQAKLSDYQQQSGIVATDDKLDIENARLADLSKQLVDSQARTDELQSRKNLLISTAKEGVSSESFQEVLDSSLIQNLKTQLARSEADFALLSKRLDRNHPQYKQAEAEVNSLQQKVNSEIKMVQHSMSSSLASSKTRDEILAKALAEQKSKVLELKKQHDQIAVLSHEVENAQKAYDAAMQRTVQTRMESEMSHTNISILNTAIPPDSPAKPKKMLNMIIAGFFGGILAIGLALMLELLDRRVRTIFDISEGLELPVFAVLQSPQPVLKFKSLKYKT